MRSTSKPLSFLRSFPYEIPPSQSTWFLRTTAISASWLALAGYTLFSLLVSPSDQLRWSTDALAALGGIALTAGYLGGLIAFSFARTLAFRLDSVVLPLLLSSVGGLFAIVLNWALHVEVETSRAYVYAPLGVACVSTVGCAAAALFLNTQRKIQGAVEESRRRHMELTGRPLSSWDAGGTPATAGTPFLEHDTRHTPHYPDGNASEAHQPPQPYTIRNMPMPPPLRHMSSTELRPIEMNIPEDEAQRRQLLRLLIAQERASDSDDPRLTAPSSGNAAQPGSGTSSTYRIDWPGSMVDEHGQLSPSFPPPPLSNAQAAAAAAAHHRQSSEISNRWSIGNLLGRKKSPAAPVVPLSAEAIREQQREERERRRREIERSSLSEQGAGAAGGVRNSHQGLLSERTAYGGGGEA